MFTLISCNSCSTCIILLKVSKHFKLHNRTVQWNPRSAYTFNIMDLLEYKQKSTYTHTGLPVDTFLRQFCWLSAYDKNPCYHNLCMFMFAASHNTRKVRGCTLNTVYKRGLWFQWTVQRGSRDSEPSFHPGTPRAANSVWPNTWREWLTWPTLTGGDEGR